jgi:hypothetical protein
MTTPHAEGEEAIGAVTDDRDCSNDVVVSQRGRPCAVATRDNALATTRKFLVTG